MKNLKSNQQETFYHDMRTKIRLSYQNGGKMLVFNFMRI